VPVNSGLRCGLRNDTATRQQPSSLQHTHPPPDPLYEHSRGSGVGVQFRGHDCHIVAYVARLALNGPLSEDVAEHLILPGVLTAHL
jgi:hypothetical protein